MNEKTCRSTTIRALRRYAAVLASASVLAVPLYPNPEEKAEGVSNSKATQTTETDVPTPDKTPSEQGTVLSKAMAASDLDQWRDATVYSVDGAKLGEIEDFAVDLKTGVATHTLVDNKGFFSGARLVAIEDLFFDQLEDRIYLSMSAEEYDQRPKYDRASRMGIDPTTTTWGMTSIGAPAPMPIQKPETGKESKASAAEDDPENTIPSTAAFSKSLIGRSISSKDGAQIGEVKKLIQAPGSPEIFAILQEIDDEELDLAIRTKGIAIRLDALSLRDGRIGANVAAAELKDAPHIDGDNTKLWKEYKDRKVISLGKNNSYAAVN